MSATNQHSSKWYPRLKYIMDPPPGGLKHEYLGLGIYEAYSIWNPEGGGGETKNKNVWEGSATKINKICGEGSAEKIKMCREMSSLPSSGFQME